MRQEQGFQRLLTIVANADTTENKGKIAAGAPGRDMSARTKARPNRVITAAAFGPHADYTVSTILPMCALVSIRACAAAASRSGKVR